MPNRIIKESICESERLSECSFFARELFDRLITYADDYGRFNADTQIMNARLYPREMDSVTQEDIISALTELAGVGKISFYTSRARKGVYGCFPKWKDHQRVRDSKKKCPEPDDTDVNDWYLQRFIPLDLKVEVIERDGFKCQICGKFITSDRNAMRLAKHGCGMYHIDHIVPVLQGGRATLENLRLTCPQCDLKKKKSFTFKEIVDFSKIGAELPQLAADCGLNPIQSESESKSESEIEANASCADKPFAPPPPFGPELTAAFNDWLEYKREKREAYKPKGLQSLITQIKKQAGVYGESTVAGLIVESMSNGWKGIIWDRLEKKQPRHGPQEREKSWAELARELEAGKHDL